MLFIPALKGGAFWHTVADNTDHYAMVTMILLI
jgi:hypothetical protein